MRKVFLLKSREETLAELQRLLSELQTEHKITPQQAFDLATAKKSVPLSIFTTERGPLQSLVIFLRNEARLDFKTISSLLGRSYQTIWTSYKIGSAKATVAHQVLQPSLMPLLSLQIPYSIFSDDRMSISEALCLFLHSQQQLRFCDIALLLNRDQRTIWTMYSRATKKGEQP